MDLPKSAITVTPFSKLLAMVLFITLPLIAFYLGTSYGKSFVSTQKAAQCSNRTDTTATCSAQKACSEEAKECPNGSFVFRQQPNCEFAACPQIITEKANPSAIAPKNGKSKEEQITIQLSQKTGITQLDLIITYKNDPETEATYDGGTYVSKKRGTTGRWIATKINGNWTVTSVSGGIPLCTDINPYFYPKELVPACKDAKGNITAR